jgi:glycerate kinase
LILAALDAGVERLLIGVGGSATNDGGAGMAVALGARLLDDAGRALPPGGGALGGLAAIDVAGLDPRLASTEVRVLADVSNPLTGPDGASAVYGPQKGADAVAIAELDRALAHFADIVARDVGIDVLTTPGGGAAGGLGAGLIAFAGARIEPGIETIATAVRLDARLAGCDVVLTGEGSLDRQSAFGKTVAGVARRAAAAGVPCLAIGGRVRDVENVRAIPGLTDVEAAAVESVPDTEAMERAGALLAEATARLVQRWQAATI